MAVKSDLGIGACRPYFNCDVTGSDVLVQTGETLVYSIDLHNGAAAVGFFLMFDAAAVADVTIGTTLPDYVLGMIASGNASQSFPKPLHFINGLVIAALTTISGTSSGQIDVSLGIA